MNRIDNEFCSHSLSAVDVSRPLIGRPYGGVSIMWRKSIGESCKIVTYNDTRLLGIQVAFSHRELLLLNVYLPYFSPENYDNYLYYIGEIDSILECSLCDDVAIFGDFNAAVGGPYFNEWNYLCDEREFIFSDVHKLPTNTYTHVNDASLTHSWLDHMLVSQNVDNAIVGIYVDYHCIASDHFPMHVELSIASLPARNHRNQSQSRIKWNFGDEFKTNEFFRILYNRLEHGIPVSNLFCSAGCRSELHIDGLDAIYEKFCDLLVDVAKHTYGESTLSGSGSNRNIPGWNILVKEPYERSRSAFRAWRQAGSPRFGHAAEDMRMK